MKEAISGVFTEGNNVLLVRRNSKRTYSSGQWDVMGGDIIKGNTPEETLRRNAMEKLNIPVMTILATLELLSDEIDDQLRRHVFVCTGDYSNVKIDPKKYDTHKWEDRNHLKDNSLTPGALHVLTALFDPA